jgi:CxxC-x17-CxxC domain-containing protein
MCTEQTLTCRDCGQPFAFTTGEQGFYAARGLTNAPGRCPECRAARKSVGGYGTSRGSRAGYEDHAPREMHEAGCDSCGGVARVPFVPRGDKPVYCSDCYNRSRGSRY